MRKGRGKKYKLSAEGSDGRVQAILDIEEGASSTHRL